MAPAVVATLAALAALGTQAPAARAADVRVGVRVDEARLGPAVGPRPIGLSFEAMALPRIAHDAARGPLVGLLRSLGPGVLRFGGSSVDSQTAFSATGEAVPWATTTIVPGDFARLARLTRRTGWRVLLAVNLGHYDPAAAAAEAAAAAAALGPDLAGIEIGNEPDAFSESGTRAHTWGYERYRTEIRAYRRAIAAAAPGVAIAGPDTVQPDHLWLAGFARDERPALLTPHYYPLVNCPPAVPTARALLSRAQARRDAAYMAAFAAIGRAFGVPVRLGESNNIGCRGRDGVSNTFTAALWAVRYQLAAARAGLTGVTFHTLPECTGYSPLCGQTRADYARGRLRAMPEWYGLLLFRHLIGDRFALAAVSPHPRSLTVDALRRPGGRGLDVVAVNAGTHRVRLGIRTRSGRRLRSGALLSLTAPALDASGGVRLAGATVDGRGGWHPRRVAHRRATRDGSLRVTVPAGSALLVRTSR
jgi:hypothetical protein